jgi:hypothetical protein
MQLPPPSYASAMAPMTTHMSTTIQTDYNMSYHSITIQTKTDDFLKVQKAKVMR